ncbi:NADH-quinone oxidoreductase subunit N [Actinomadura parmotrematis]|uniref:NADH-quinone oxidoreductase subunit N n=1 Tax=Actinomadura parmotrematis TaxID=2864039 RepID=A0ABS7FXF5_9ACTN|nr:NADH-quinone oxidoreductase subunit N [Actinomadura parmotrematis]MBW8485103.1 NADH-quinone oxidoreductase subunit N [Actinomadura parmotrematis]
MIQHIDYAAVAPPLILAAAALAVLLADAFGLPRRALAWASAGSLAAALAAVLVLAAGDRRATFCLPGGLRGGGPASCSYVADRFTLLFQAVVLIGAIVVVLLSAQEIADADVPAGEYHFLLLAAVIGAVTLVAARDLVLLVAALETLSLPVFALVGLRRYDGAASEAALKLFLFSVVSAAVMLFGVSLVYGATGALHLDRIAPALDALPDDLDPVAAVGIVLVLGGFAFKIAAVPFHFWAPDVYQGAPLPVAAFLSVVSKAAGFAGLAVVLALGFPAYGHVWGPLAGVLAAVTMTLGNLMALRQRTAIRLLAWSSVAQSGYMLAPLAVGRDHLPEAVAATASYVALYAVMNLGAFAVLTGARRRGPATPHADTLADFAGLARRAPGTAAALAFFLICLAGLPPGVMGLFAKVVVFRATLAGDVTWLAVVMAVNTVIGLYYYLAWAVRLFTVPAEGTADAAYAARPGLPVRAAIAAAFGGAIVLSIAPQLVLQTVAAAG